MNRRDVTPKTTAQPALSANKKKPAKVKRWKVVPSARTKGRFIVATAEGLWVCDVDGNDAERRAHLFAAAPELLDHVHAQHQVIDTLMAMLITLTANTTCRFMPTKAPFWPTVRATPDLLARARGPAA